MIRVAVIGLGIGRVHLREYEAHPGVELVAVVDVVKERCQEVAAKHGLAPFQTIGDMLECIEVDAASVCTPPAFHAEQVDELAGAGVHVLVEKPMAPSIRNCQRMIAAADEAGVKLMVGQKKRFSPLYMFLKEMFEGEFGQPLWACVKYALGRVDKPWFWDEEDGGGPILENAIHVFDLLRFLMGEVELVYAQGGHLFYPGFADQIDSAAVVLRFHSGGCASVGCGYGSEWGFAEEHLSLATPLVCCDVSGPFDRANSLRYIERSDPGVLDKLTFADTNDFRGEIAEFVAAIEENRAPKVTGQDAARSIAVALAVKRSIREGRPVMLAEMDPYPR